MVPAFLQDHPAIYLLADHLDGVLAAGEDLLALRLALTPCRCEAEARQAGVEMRDYVSRLQTLELSVVMHILQARERAREVRRFDPRFVSLANLFLAGTTPLAEAASDIGDTTGFDFRTGGDCVCFVRSRAMIPADASGVHEIRALEVTERFRVAGLVELGPLLDLVSTFASTLEQHYDVYAEESDASGPADHLAARWVATTEVAPPHSLQERLLRISNMLAYSTGPAFGPGDHDAIRDAVSLRP